MFHVTNLVLFLLPFAYWHLKFSHLSLTDHLSEGMQLEFRHSKILNTNKTYCSPLQIFRVSLISHGTRCFVISKLGTEFILHRGRASFHHLSCFWNPYFSVHTAPIMLFPTEFLLGYHTPGRHFWEWERGTSSNGEDQTHPHLLRDYWYDTDIHGIILRITTLCMILDKNISF